MLKKTKRLLSTLTNNNDTAGELYKSLFKKSHSIMILIHPETGNIIDANPAACKFYQYSKEQLLNMSILDINILSPQEIRDEMENAQHETRNYFNFKHKLATGIIRDVEVYSSPIRLAENEVLYSIIHDITDRLKVIKEKEKALFDLENAKKDIKSLKGILPLCSFCKKIRDTKGHWEEVDKYIHHHSEADISHSVCPKCMKQHYPEDSDSKESNE